jgi:hypothetical protein
LIVFTDTTIHSRRLKAGETLSLAGLAERTRLAVADLKPLLHSLACAKYKVSRWVLHFLSSLVPPV